MVARRQLAGHPRPHGERHPLPAARVGPRVRPIRRLDAKSDTAAHSRSPRSLVPGAAGSEPPPLPYLAERGPARGRQPARPGGPDRGSRSARSRRSSPSRSPGTTTPPMPTERASPSCSRTSRCSPCRHPPRSPCAPPWPTSTSGSATPPRPSSRWPTPRRCSTRWLATRLGRRRDRANPGRPRLPVGRLRLRRRGRRGDRWPAISATPAAPACATSSASPPRRSGDLDARGRRRSSRSSTPAAGSATSRGCRERSATSPRSSFVAGCTLSRPRHQRECLALAFELGSTAMVAFSLIVAARLEALEERWEQATVLHTQAESILDELGLVLYEDDQRESDMMLERAHHALGDVRYGAARAGRPRARATGGRGAWPTRSWPRRPTRFTTRAGGRTMSDIPEHDAERGWEGYGGLRTRPRRLRLPPGRDRGRRRPGSRRSPGPCSAAPSTPIPSSCSAASEQRKQTRKRSSRRGDESLPCRCTDFVLQTTSTRPRSIRPRRRGAPPRGAGRPAQPRALLPWLRVLRTAPGRGAGSAASPARRSTPRPCRPVRCRSTPRPSRRRRSTPRRSSASPFYAKDLQATGKRRSSAIPAVPAARPAAHRVDGPRAAGGGARHGHGRARTSARRPLDAFAPARAALGDPRRRWRPRARPRRGSRHLHRGADRPRHPGMPAQRGEGALQLRRRRRGRHRASASTTWPGRST